MRVHNYRVTLDSAEGARSRPTGRGRGRQQDTKEDGPDPVYALLLCVLGLAFWYTYHG